MHGVGRPMSSLELTRQMAYDAYEHERQAIERALAEAKAAAKAG